MGKGFAGRLGLINDFEPKGAGCHWLVFWFRISRVLKGWQFKLLPLPVRETFNHNKEPKSYEKF
jgi:hypothetical protein